MNPDTFFVLIDTETTGLAPTDEVIEVAAWHVDRHLHRWGRFQTFIKPTNPIPPFISGLTGITNDDVRFAPSRAEADFALRKFVPEDAIIVAHNAAFDAVMLDTLDNGLGNHQWLCTKRLAQHLVTDISDSKLQTLRYYFDPSGKEVDMLGLDPHRAEADVAVMLHVLYHLVDRFGNARGSTLDADEFPYSGAGLLKLAAQPIIFKALPFGKHQGVPLENVDPSYLRWLLRDGKPDADIRASVERVLAAPAARGPF